jgi:uncharacterized membrane protein
MSKLFWTLTVAMIALAAHISYVLFAPTLLFQQKLFLATEGRSDNSFFILAAEKQGQLFPAATVQDVVGVCKFDLGAGQLVLSASLPKTYWTLAIYTQSGKQVYALDDAQAGSNAFTIELSRAKSFFEQVWTAGEADDLDQIENLGWRVETSERRGLAIVWIPLSDELMRKPIEAIIKESRCEPKASS